MDSHMRAHAHLHLKTHHMRTTRAACIHARTHVGTNALVHRHTHMHVRLQTYAHKCTWHIRVQACSHTHKYTSGIRELRHEAVCFQPAPSCQCGGVVTPDKDTNSSLEHAALPALPASPALLLTHLCRFAARGASYHTVDSYGSTPIQVSITACVSVITHKQRQSTGAWLPPQSTRGSCHCMQVCAISTHMHAQLNDLGPARCIPRRCSLCFGPASSNALQSCRVLSKACNLTHQPCITRLRYRTAEARLASSIALSS